MNPTLRWLVCAALLFVLPAIGRPAAAQNQDPAVDAATRVLQQATLTFSDRQHHAILRGLRSTRDPELRPLYTWLSRQTNPDQRAHGILALAETSPQRKIDLAQLVEISDPRQRVEIIGAALDDDLLGPMEMSQLVGWKDLNQGARQAIAIRLLADGGVVDPALFEPAIVGEPTDAAPGQLLERAIAGLALTQLGDDRGPRVLAGLADLQPAAQRDAVRGQIAELALRHGFKAAGPWAMDLAKDESVDIRLRNVALRAALRLEVPGASAYCQTRYRTAESLADKIRIVLIAVEAAPWVQPSLYSGMPDSGLPQIDRLLAAGKAAAGDQPDLTAPMSALVQLGYPQGNRWVLVYAREHGGSQALPLLKLVMSGYLNGADEDRAQLTTLATEAASTMVDLDTRKAADLLIPLLGGDTDDKLHQIILAGLYRSSATDLRDLISRIPPQKDPASQDLHNLLRLRSGLDLQPAEWERVRSLFTVPGRVDPATRAQLAWYYLKQTGQAQDQLRKILQQAK